MNQHRDDLETQVQALDRGRGFVDRSTFRRVEVVGSEAVAWLDDLVTAGVERLEPAPGRAAAARSLLLTPTGRIRADFHVIRTPDTLLLVQDPSQPADVSDLLRPYVLSSDVELREARLALFSVPGRPEAPGSLATPSMLGDGVDVLAAPEARDAVRESLAAGLHPVTEEAVEVWRIRRGLPRFPIDLDEESLPAEAGLDELLVDFEKGCFLGQESVAKVRNLGHPGRVVLPIRAQVPVAAGAAVLADGEHAGTVTSAVPLPKGGSAGLARVRWDLREAALVLETGDPLAREQPGARPRRGGR